MLPFSQKARLIKLRSIFAWDLAKMKQEGKTFFDEKEELDSLSMIQISSYVTGALNEDAETRGSPVERAEAIFSVISTAFMGLKMLRKEDPEIAYMLGVEIQAQLERTLRGKLDDPEEPRSSGNGTPEH